MRLEDGEALGSGSAGAVFALPTDEGDFAFKVFPGRLYQRTRLGLERELERLSALDGQVLVPDTIEELPDGRCALRSELCVRSLLDLVESAGPLSVADTLVLGSAIASTLARAHEAGIFHDRVTPANVLFRASGEPVINDFERTLRPVFVRDPDHGSDFLAPEGPHGESADLYGLGAVLHFALTGLPPGPDRPELHRVDAPIDLLALTENLLAEDPDSRPAGAAVVEEILTALVPEQSTVDAEKPVLVSQGIQGFPLVTIAPEPASTPALRKRSAWPALTIGAATVLAAAAWFLLSGSTETPPRALAQPSPAMTSTSPKPAPRVELDAPIDHGSMVELTWRAPEGFDSAVVVADGTGEAKTTIVRRQRTMKVPVDPGRKYCFLIQITDGGGVQESEPRSIRGAICRGY